MASEKPTLSKESLGIETTLGSSIIIATFPLMLPDPKNPVMDLEARRTAAWLTAPLPMMGDGFESVIGPNGQISPIIVRWTEEGLKFFIYPPKGLRLIPVQTEPDETVVIANVPEGGVARLVGKTYPERGLRENYTVLKFPGPQGSFTRASFAPYADDRRLISGMRRRPFLPKHATGFLATRITDKTELPFGRDLQQGRK